MLAVLSQAKLGAARLLDVRLEATDDSSHSLEDEEAFSLDMNAITAFFPSPDSSWRHVAGVCGQAISPAYKSIRTVLNEDVENIARLLYDLDPWEKKPDQNNDAEIAIPASRPQHLSGNTKPPANCHHKRWTPSNAFDGPILFPSKHSSAPSILITPCATPSRPCSSRVPLQDASYGNKLVVPGYPHLNSWFAPLVLKPGYAPLLVERWKWREGHWWAIVPDLEVQGRKGWFSRPISARRRAARPCRTGPLSVDYEEL